MLTSDDAPDVHAPAPADRGDNGSMDWVPVVVTAVVLAAALTTVHALTCHRHLVDLQVYRKGAWAFLHGRNPYSKGIPGPKLPYTYTPFSTIVFAPLSMMPLGAAMVAHTFVSLTALFTSVFLVIRTLGRHDARPRTLLAYAVAAVLIAYLSEPVVQTLGFGQINLVLMGLIVVDLLALRSTRWCGVLIGIAAGIKLTPLVFIVYLVARKRFRPATVASISAAATVAIGYLFLPGPSNEYWFKLAGDAKRIGNPGYVTNQSLNGMWIRFAKHLTTAHHLWQLSALVVLIFGIWLARELGERLSEPAGMAAAAFTGLLISPISWSHHWVWWTVPALVLGHRALTRRSPWAAAAMVAWALPFYAAPFWHVRRRVLLAAPRISTIQLRADLYPLVALVAMVAAAVWLSRADRSAPGIAQQEPAVADGQIAATGEPI